MHAMLPEVVVTEDLWKGEDFYVVGPHRGPSPPELYFDGPILPSKVIKLEASIVWNDQGWGNRKGELIVRLMRPNCTGEPFQIAELWGLFDTAPHREMAANKEVDKDHPVIAKSKKGDFYRFMRRIGGGGGHTLKVKNFRVKVTVCRKSE